MVRAIRIEKSKEMNMRSILLLLAGLSAVIYFSSCNIAEAKNSLGVEAYQTTPEGLSWYAIEDLEKMKNLEGKKVMIDMYTSWCGWCKVMDKKTFTDQRVIDYLNEHFVLVKFNAEQREPVTFKGETYEWMSAGRRGVNKLALKLMNGRMGYPTMVYLDSNLEPIKSIPGYKTPEQLLGDLQVL